MDKWTEQHGNALGDYVYANPNTMFYAFGSRMGRAPHTTWFKWVRTFKH